MQMRQRATEGSAPAMTRRIHDLMSLAELPALDQAAAFSACDFLMSRFSFCSASDSSLSLAFMR